jgi:hypothetical protein
VAAKNKKVSRAFEEENNVLRVISSSLQEQTKALQEQAKKSKNSPLTESKDSDENETYGKYVANELRSVADPYTTDYIKHEFSRILFSAKWGASNIRPAVSNSAMSGNSQVCNNSQIQSFLSMSMNQQQPYCNSWNQAASANEQSQYFEQSPWLLQRSSQSATSVACDQYSNMNQTRVAKLRVSSFESES